MIKALCINDKNKPSQIPITHWIKKDNWYTITHVYNMKKFNNILGVTLKEIDLLSLKDCPYEQFRLDRFAIKEEDLEKLFQLIKDCGELNDVDIEKLMKEVNQLELVLVNK